MTKNPSLNAVAASTYIVALVFLINHLSKNGEPDNTLLAPIVALSLFTLSAAIMGYLFLGEPIQMYLDGKKKEAVAFFMQTVGTFAAITVIFLGILFSGLVT